MGCHFRMNVAQKLFSATAAVGALICIYAVYCDIQLNFPKSEPFCNLSRGCSSCYPLLKLRPLSYFHVIRAESVIDVSIAAVGIALYSGLTAYPMLSRSFPVATLGMSSLLGISSVYSLFMSHSGCCPIGMALSVSNVALMCTNVFDLWSSGYKLKLS